MVEPDDRDIITHQQEVVILWFCTKVLEDGLFPVSLHMVPVVDLPMSDRIVNTIPGSLCIREGFVTNEEIQVFYSAFRCKVTRL